MRVQVDNNRNLKVSGERPLDNNRSSRFYKEVPIPENCDLNDLRARFEQGILYISVPKTIPWVGVNEQTKPTKESPPSQNISKTQDSEKDSTDADMKPTNSTTTRDVTKKEATSTDAEKQKTGSKGVESATTDETKKKEEEEKKDETRKTYEGSTEKEANGGLLKESYMHGGGLLLGLDESRQLVVNVVVGLLVMLALLVYILQKITS